MGPFSVGGVAPGRFVLGGLSKRVVGGNAYGNEPRVFVIEGVETRATWTLGDLLGAFVQVSVSAEDAAPEKLLFQETMVPADRQFGVDPDGGNEESEDGAIERKGMCQRNLNH